jgi:hypothetical protein
LATIFYREQETSLEQASKMHVYRLGNRLLQHASEDIIVFNLSSNALGKVRVFKEGLGFRSEKFIHSCSWLEARAGRGSSNERSCLQTRRRYPLLAGDLWHRVGHDWSYK